MTKKKAAKKIHKHGKASRLGGIKHSKNYPLWDPIRDKRRTDEGSAECGARI
jgi:hypothetical protein